ncbi:hypothetical protein AMECASPLE_013761 [Ameca splendens]|uniref:Uncharacterized protein n=1 Tax=Ameca splendens TaxID=208324 RepID=A0ABV1A7R6_9TELE
MAVGKNLKVVITATTGAVSGSCSCLDQDTTDNLGQCLLWTNSPAGSLQLTGTRLPFANPVHPPAEFPLPSSRRPGPLQARHALSLVDMLLPITARLQS